MPSIAPSTRYLQDLSEALKESKPKKVVLPKAGVKQYNKAWDERGTTTSGVEAAKAAVWDEIGKSKAKEKAAASKAARSEIGKAYKARDKEIETQTKAQKAKPVSYKDPADYPEPADTSKVRALGGLNTEPASRKKYPLATRQTSAITPVTKNSPSAKSALAIRQSSDMVRPGKSTSDITHKRPSKEAEIDSVARQYALPGTGRKALGSGPTVSSSGAPKGNSAKASGSASKKQPFTTSYRTPEPRKVRISDTRTPKERGVSPVSSVSGDRDALAVLANNSREAKKREQYNSQFTGKGPIRSAAPLPTRADAIRKMAATLKSAVSGGVKRLGDAGRGALRAVRGLFGGKKQVQESLRAFESIDFLLSSPMNEGLSSIAGRVGRYAAGLGAAASLAMSPTPVSAAPKKPVVSQKQPKTAKQPKISAGCDNKDQCSIDSRPANVSQQQFDKEKAETEARMRAMGFNPDGTLVGSKSESRA